MRFKADEAAQTITGNYRQTHPEDNNERQSVHEHVSVALAERGASGQRRNSARRSSTSSAKESAGLAPGAKGRSGKSLTGTTKIVPFPRPNDTAKAVIMPKPTAKSGPGAP